MRGLALTDFMLTSETAATVRVFLTMNMVNGMFERVAGLFQVATDSVEQREGEPTRVLA